MKEIWILILSLHSFSAAQTNGVKPVLAPLAQFASPGEFPHQVSLQMGRKHFCGGSLITLQHVLTAAHCIDEHIESALNVDNYRNLLQETLIVKAGSIDLANGQRRKVTRLAVDRRYTHVESQSPTNDIAVVTLDEPFKESQDIKPIHLPQSDSEIYQGTFAVVTGFGQPSKTDTIPSFFLRKSTMVIVPKSECDERFKLDFTRKNSNFCAKMEAGHGACEGDSGGPLQANGILIGVVSCRMEPDCGLGQPDLYVRVSDFLPFIESEMNPKFTSNDGFGAFAKAVNIGAKQDPGFSRKSRDSERFLQNRGGQLNPGFSSPRAPQKPRTHPQQAYPENLYPQLHQPQLIPHYEFPQPAFPPQQSNFFYQQPQFQQPQVFHPQTQFLVPHHQYHIQIPQQGVGLFETVPQPQQSSNQIYIPHYQPIDFPLNYLKKK